MFAIAHLLYVPLITSPVWGVQLFLLLKTAAGKNWARLLLSLSTVLLTYLVIRVTEWQSAFSRNSFNIWLELSIRVVPAAMQLVALPFMFSIASNRWFLPINRGRSA
jgi:hypothetical protein